MTPGGNPERSGGAAAGSAATPSLDTATLTVLARPTCGEASTVWSPGPVSPDYATSFHASAGAIRSGLAGIKVRRPKKGFGSDPVRAEAEANRRASARVRRWCVHRRANRLGTLTYKVAEHSYDVVWDDLEQFRRELTKAGIPSDSVLLVPEAHPGPKDANGDQCGDSHGWHVHLALARYVPVDVLRSCWEKATPNAGFVDIRKIRVPGGSGSGPAGARVTARYVAKTLAAYVTKAETGRTAGPGSGESQGACDWTPAPRRPPNRKRFSIAKGEQPPVIRFTILDPSMAWAAVREAVGFPMAVVWVSPPDWGKGPPVAVWHG